MRKQLSIVSMAALAAGLASPALAQGADAAAEEESDGGTPVIVVTA
ncbi:MAG: hypothetical protein R3E18_11740 [Sphingomonadaceae bacterium]